MALHDAIVADVDYTERGCPACRAKPVPHSPPYVAHVLGECWLMAVLERVDAVLSDHAGERMKL
jgi:hypothetical protein